MKAAAIAIGLIVLGASPSTAQAGPVSEQIVVTVEPSTIGATLGDTLDLQVSITNTGEPLSDLVVHIDITALDDSGSVDPEDWTSTLSRTVGEIGSDETVTVDWRLQPISAGTFSLYAVVLSPDDTTVAASNILRVGVDDRRSLNPNGILPIAIGAPAVVGGLLAVQIRQSHRRRRRHIAST